MSNFNQSKIDIKNVSRDTDNPTLFWRFDSVFGINNKRIIPIRGNAINSNNIDEYSNILLKT